MSDEEIKPEEQTTSTAQPVVQPADDAVRQPVIEYVQTDSVVEPTKEDVPVIQDVDEPVVETSVPEQVVQETSSVQVDGSEDIVLGETSPSKEGTVDAIRQPEVVERVVEKVIEKPLSEEDRERIYREELQKHLPLMNAKKHESYERHLQEIVDFIKEKHTLVSNQDIEEGLKIPDSTVTDRLNELIKRGIVARIGDDKHAKYRLTAGV